ncbi:hypothetical protein CASFOL_014960 [Castilleja foliolosa]|uniref:glucan endo-1,3-beta-D-glucosidase n=1 Tax=Castilleja foliolosa TaxID=1961234 RepID=A0ABD3DGD7_9LAMI
MIFHKHSLHTLCVLIFTLSTILTVFSDSGTIGINYGRIADNLPPPQQVVQLLKEQGITKAKIFDADATVLSAFSGSGISITVAIPNEQLPAAASDQSYTDTWIQSNILPHHPNTLIESIAVGNEVFVDPGNTTEYLVPAMNNLYASLAKYDVASSIKISSPIALSALETSYPSSSGSFKPDLVEPVIRPMLQFLNKTSSFLMVNAYPFFAYTDNADTISLDYALFRDNSGNVDPNNGLVYKNLLDAQIDAVYAAMSKLGFENMIRIVVTETGWPSKGDEDEIGANEENAAAYNGNLMRRTVSGGGTPMRPDEPLDVFLFAIFNENQKPGPVSERNYGLFYPDMQRVYDVPLASGELNRSKIQVTASAEAKPPSGGGVGETWCVANENIGTAKLQEALDYACGQGRGDCRSIQPGATCHNLNTLVDRASYVFNSYYQRNERRSGTCDFGGTAYVVTQRPNFGGCD